MEVVVLPEPLDFRLAGVDAVYPGYVAVDYLADVAASGHGYCWRRGRRGTFGTISCGGSGREGDYGWQHTLPVARDGGRLGCCVRLCVWFGLLHSASPLLGL